MTKKEKINYELNKIGNITFASSLYAFDIASKKSVKSLRKSSECIVNCSTDILNSVAELRKLLGSS